MEKRKSEIMKTINLKKYFPVQKSFLDRLLAKELEYVHAVDDVSFSIREGEVFCLVGESGCGKSTTGYLIVRLLEPTSGRIIYNGIDITKLEGNELRVLRKEIQIIFQDPYASLNPRMKIGDIIKHPLDIHDIGTPRERTQKVYEILRSVGLYPPERFYDKYPHQLSGGQRQRVAIARSLILEPRFVVADEPTSMLDVSVQAEIVNLMLHMKKKYNLTYLYITHDFGIASQICDRIAVMYLGKIVEIGRREEILRTPRHPYTIALLTSIPGRKTLRKRLIIGEEVPNAIKIPSGCRFHNRCPYIKDVCKEEEPELRKISETHYAACHFIEKIKEEWPRLY